MFVTSEGHPALFRGASKTIKFDYEDVVSITMFLDGLRFHMSNRERVDTFQMSGAPVAAAAINAVAKADDATKATYRERLSQVGR